MKKQRYFILIVSVILMGGMLYAAGVSEDEGVESAEVKAAVQASEVPDVIKQAIESNFPKGQIVDIQKELAGDRLVQYDAVIRSQEKVFDVEISPAGKIIETKERKTSARSSAKKPDQQWTRSFNLEDRTLGSTGRNPYFILEPGHQRILATPGGDKLIITVLKDTKIVNGVETRIVEEREWEGGQLVEVSRNFFALCNRTNDVFYFGEEVDDYENGKIVSHGGAWLAGKNGAIAGLVMPGTFLLGARYYQEIAQDIALDRGENAAMDLSIDTPAGTFDRCVKVVETTPLELGESIKIYAPGIGLIVDDEFRLVEVKTGASQ